ncbi:unnamed protein product, partial [Scytosiphon promiscuus]
CCVLSSFPLCNSVHPPLCFGRQPLSRHERPLTLVNTADTRRKSHSPTSAGQRQINRLPATADLLVYVAWTCRVVLCSSTFCVCPVRTYARVFDRVFSLLLLYLGAAGLGRNGPGAVSFVLSVQVMSPCLKF